MFIETVSGELIPVSEIVRVYTPRKGSRPCPDAGRRHPCNVLVLGYRGTRLLPCDTRTPRL